MAEQAWLAKAKLAELASQPELHSSQASLESNFSKIVD